MAREDLHFRLRIPEDLKAEIERAASDNNRSMTAEIVSRLQDSFKSPYPALSGAGFEALVKRIEASQEALEELFFVQRDIARADTGRPTVAEWRALQMAPKDCRPRIIAALADGDVDLALTLAQRAR